MKKINIFLACFLLVFSLSIHAQVDIEWQKSLGDTSESLYPATVTQNRDGGYVIAGSYVTTVQNSIPYRNYDILVIKVNNTGSVQWQKVLGEPDSREYASVIKQTADGGYIIAASKDYHFDYWIIKLDATGSTVWEKSIGGSGDEHATDIQQTTDGGYIVAGYTDSNDGDVTGNNGGSDDYWIVKLNSSGNIVWEKSLGGSGGDKAQSIRQTNDGGYIVVGGTSSNDGDVTGNHGGPFYYSDAWVVKLNSTGAIQWQKCIGGTGRNDGDVAYSVEQTTDGGYIFAGSTTSNDGDVSGYHGGYYDSWVVKLSNAGTIQWQKCLGGSDQEQARSIKQTADGGYIVAGYTLSENGQVSGNHDGSSDFWITKLNSSGDLQWQKCFGSSGQEDAYVIELTTDGGYIVSGSSVYSNLPDDGDVIDKQGRMDFWVVKLTAEQKLLVPITTTVTKNITGNSATDVDSLNYKLVTLTPTGGQPNALNGNVTTTATVNSTISTFNSLPFVRRHYDITPAVNAANAQATVTLYFTQHDFDLFNAYVTTNNLTIPLLPTGGVDNGNLRITQFHGNFTGTSDPANYSNGTTLITPPTLTVTWDNFNDFWLVTFPVTHFSGFYLSTVELPVLPLTLLEFKGTLQNNTIDLFWLTSGELNTKEFIVERSNNSIEYAAIGKVQAQSSAGDHQYNFSDVSPLPANNFYRLRMVDKDSKFTYSNIVQIKSKHPIAKITVYPNPLVNNSIKLQFINQQKGNYNVKLISQSGQVLLTKQILHSDDKIAETIELNANTPKGYYFLEIIGPDSTKRSLKIIY